jgi:hypothetical protein
VLAAGSLVLGCVRLRSVVARDTGVREADAEIGRSCLAVFGAVTGISHCLSHLGLSTGEVILALRNQLDNCVSRGCSVCSVVQARASGATSGLRVCPRQWTLLGFQPHYTAQISLRQSILKLRLTVQMAFCCSSEWKSSAGICLQDRSLVGRVATNGVRKLIRAS